jgi:hypothetical protein
MTSTRYVPAPHDNLNPPPQPSVRYRDNMLSLLAARLTRRDRELIRLLRDHRVLTTHQVAELAYGCESRARHRMLALARMGVVERFRPLLPAGSAPLHYVLGEVGARVLAAEQDITLAELGYRRDRVLGIAYSPQLAHTVGVNGLFTALVAAARRHPQARLAAWWPEHRCAATWGQYARPDAYGRWQEDGASIDFFVEYDTGTEPLAKVASKLAGYAELASATGITTAVLVWTLSPSREARLHRHMRSSPVPVATATPRATPDSGGWGPAGPAWLPVGEPGARARLIELGGRLASVPQPGHMDRPEAADE